MAKKILIIDDEELITKSLLKLLTKEGYVAVITKNGKEAIAKIEKDNFDLIISDVRMPEMDGLETIKRIRTCLEQAKRKMVPEILITGYADMDKYVSARDLEVFDCLYKPFDNQEFLRIIKNALGN